jgi:hypothetical protein
MGATVSAPQLELGWNVHTRGESIDLRWARWLGEHPKALRDFHEIAAELMEAGETRLSAKFLAEIFRYRQIIRKAASDRYLFNNDFTSRLARALEATYPELRGKFETRELISMREPDAGGDA